MAVRAQAIIPALADRLGLRASAGEADRHADTRGEGLSSASNSGAMPAATRLSQLSGCPASCFLLLQIACPAMAMPSAGTRTPKNAAREGAAGSMGMVRPQRSEARPRLIPLRGEAAGTAFPQRRSTPAHAVTAGQGPRPWPHARIVTLCAKTACGLGRSLQAEIEPCPKGRARYVFLMSK
jgi:hypothetical protein